MKITVIGLGPGDLGQMPLSLYRFLKNSNMPLFLRTGDHPAAKELLEEGLSFSTFDFLYTALEEDFERVYPAIVEELLKELKKEPIVYAVPGHPMVAESTTELLLQDETLDIEVLGGKSFIDDLLILFRATSEIFLLKVNVTTTLLQIKINLYAA